LQASSPHTTALPSKAKESLTQRLNGATTQRKRNQGMCASTQYDGMNKASCKHNPLLLTLRRCVRKKSFKVIPDKEHPMKNLIRRKK